MAPLKVNAVIPSLWRRLLKYKGLSPELGLCEKKTSARAVGIQEENWG